MTQNPSIETETASAKSAGGSPWPAAVGGIILAFAGPASYMMLMDVPWIRSTGASAFVLLLLGLWLSIVAMKRGPRISTKILAGLNFAWVGLFFFGFFVMSAVPDSPKFEGLKTAPEFTLKDENNNAVSLADARAKGPVLLVFYRGFW
ncbi:hypothetical protein B7486_03540 [cyanobacterium TDX16]|nr:hypothetical protein B7486_03540 [cyanobacterium TDX16]